MINRNQPLRLDWQQSYYPRRTYFARVNESLVLNVHRITPDSPTWEWVLIGFDLSKSNAPAILQIGKAGTMKEAKLLAEQAVPTGTPKIGQIELPLPPDDPEVPF